MKVLVTAVGHRTEHWTDLFGVLCRRPDVELTVAVSDVSSHTDRTLRAYEEASLLRYHRLPHVLTERSTGHMASVLFRPGALAALRAWRPDVVHVIGEAAYLSTAQVVRWRARRFADVPLTLYAAQNILMRFPGPFPWLERRAFGAVQHAFPITPAALNVLRTRGYGGGATVVPLGVDTRLFTPEPQPRRPPWSRFTAGFVGRLEPHKGVADLLEAARRVDCDLLVVGRGSLSGAVREEAASRPGRIVLRDWVDHEELPALLRRMDVLVLPSAMLVQRNVLPWVRIALAEQFGRVLVEAMACGVPVIGSDVGEIPHVIGSAGLTYPTGDVATLADRLVRLRGDPDLARRLGRSGARRAVTQFSWHRAAATMAGVWHDVLGTRGVATANGADTSVGGKVMTT